MGTMIKYMLLITSFMLTSLSAKIVFDYTTSAEAFVVFDDKHEFDEAFRRVKGLPSGFLSCTKIDKQLVGKPPKGMSELKGLIQQAVYDFKEWQNAYDEAPPKEFRDTGFDQMVDAIYEALIVD